MGEAVSVGSWTALNTIVNDVSNSFKHHALYV